MPKTHTVTIERVSDPDLRRQTKALTEIMAYLSTGEESPNAEDWPEAIEGLLNLLAAIGADIDRQVQR
jgi:hypothetical protein